MDTQIPPAFQIFKHTHSFCRLYMGIFSFLCFTHIYKGKVQNPHSVIVSPQFLFFWSYITIFGTRSEGWICFSLMMASVQSALPPAPGRETESAKQLLSVHLRYTGEHRLTGTHLDIRVEHRPAVAAEQNPNRPADTHRHTGRNWNIYSNEV